ncbi:MAG: hypothetical protein PH343_01535 [Nitrospira sp.]|nr:hypothetical protein [Nitrospira sp.]
MNIFEFSQEIIDTCAVTTFIKTLETILFDDPVAKFRAKISDNFFIEIFFNSETDKHSFALIKNKARIYGADNTKDWHIHPFESPDAHIPSTAISFKEFIKTLEDNKDQWLESPSL